MHAQCDARGGGQGREAGAGAGADGAADGESVLQPAGAGGAVPALQGDAEATPLPVLLYNIPGRTGANLEPATVLRLAEIPNVVGIKESSGNLAQITELIVQAPPSFKVFSGDDGLALPVLALGGAGLISVASNVIPAQMAQMVSAAMAGDWATARKVNREFYRLMQAHFWSRARLR